MIRNDTMNFQRPAVQFFLGNIALAPFNIYRLRVDLRRRPSPTGTSKEND
jgi:hypothetical protein